MKTRLTSLIIVFIVLGSTTFCQNVIGKWYGVGNVGKNGNYSQYLSELILKQKGNKVYGEFNYYFKSSYVPAKVSGTYNGTTRVLELNIFPLLNYQAANINGADCPMKGFFLLKLSKIETTLSGQFETTDHYKYTCPSIALRLKKEIITPEEKKKLANGKTREVDNEENTIAEVGRVGAKANEGVKGKIATAEKKVDTTALTQIKTRPVFDATEAITTLLKKDRLMKVL